MNLPAKCQRCGYLFHTNAIRVTGNVRLLTSGTGQDCPRCGGFAPVAEGEYLISGEEYKLVAGPVLSRQIVKQLAAIVDHAKMEGLNSSEIIELITGVSPEIAEKIKAKPLSPMVILCAILLLIKSCVPSLSMEIDLNQLIDQAESIIDKMTDEEAIAHISTLSGSTPENSYPSANQKVSRQVRRQEERRLKKAKERAMRMSR